MFGPTCAVSAQTESGAWLGHGPTGPWTWECRFPEPRPVAAVLQHIGDHPFVLRHAPRDYTWEATTDGVTWQPLPGTRIRGERRLIRSFRWPRPWTVRGLRLTVTASGDGTAPALRSVDFLPPSDGPSAASPPWILVVNSTHDPALPGHGQEFIPLARSCPGWEKLAAQQVWVPDLDPALLAVEPRPLAIFLSGSFKDWCEVDRSHWRGVERVLRGRRFPIWASCGGAQALAILAHLGTDQPWDCPHCRPPHPRRPAIYGHVGHDSAGPFACGDYAHCTFERGPHAITRVGHDPAFDDLPASFPAMESHCGQIEFVPRGWELVATAGPGTRTRQQCLRRRDAPIYAAQFHIEMAGTPETSRTIMANFLRLATAWSASTRAR